LLTPYLYPAQKKIPTSSLRLVSWGLHLRCYIRPSPFALVNNLTLPRSALISAEIPAPETSDWEDRHQQQNRAILANFSLSSGTAGHLTASMESPAQRNRPGRRNTRAQSATVSWRDLPRREQLIVITLARLSEPLVQTSIQSYMFYQLKWFDPSLPDSVISSQAGILQCVSLLCAVAQGVVNSHRLSASFTAAQFITAMMWGRIADSSLFGRKTVLMIGLGGTSEFLTQPLFFHRVDLTVPVSSALLSWVRILHVVLAGSGL